MPQAVFVLYISWCPYFQITVLFVITSWCFLFPLATTSPSCVGLVLVWWLICDWQEKTIPGGVTIAVATGY